MTTNHTQEEFDRLKAVNAELLAALLASEQAQNGPWDGAEQARHIRHAQNLARAAIAKARGE